jgi:acyl-CoA reductase-like NAD-dependent aldehyde dehydrogenase
METLTGNPPFVAVEEQARREIESLVARARSAQAAIESYTQEEADALAISVGWQVYKSREVLAKLAVEEGGFGNVPDKITKIGLRVLGTLADMASVKTCGVVEEDAARGLIKIAKPVGVIAALIPTTGPDATPPVKALAALKARNAIIISPHPRTRKTSAAVVEVMRKGCVQVGSPDDLIQSIEHPSIAKTDLLMRMSDLVVATGGASMVKAAYSSGTPAYGVGVGNSIAALAGVELAPDRSFFFVEEDGVGEAHPFSGEKLSVVLALYRYRGEIDSAIGLVNRITSYQGAGHTCGIHSRRDDHVMALALGTKTARVMVNQNLNEGAGSIRNALPYTLSLSCGSWGGNITTENVNVRHFLNLTWVSRPVAPHPVAAEEIFRPHWAKYGND